LDRWDRDSIERRQRLPSFAAHCNIAPLRGEPATFVVSAALDGERPTTLISHDVGETWSDRTPAGSDGEGAAALFAFLRPAIAREGRLYTMVGSQPAQGEALAPRFAVSVDDGQTWTPIEAHSETPSERDRASSVIAPDYRTSGAWYRLFGVSGGFAGESATIERSSDDGRTWTPVRTLGSGLNDFFAAAQSIATTLAQPKRICAIYALAGRGNLQLARSDDAGATWTIGPLPGQDRVRFFATPDLAMDTAGACYLEPLPGRMTIPTRRGAWCGACLPDVRSRCR
jgi:hypothetical protein